MTEIKHCPQCHKEMRSEMVDLAKGSPAEGYFTEVWRCPNAINHGKMVECENRCGKPVPNPQFHYHYTPGLIGSGAWQCFPKEDNILDRLEGWPTEEMKKMRERAIESRKKPPVKDDPEQIRAEYERLREIVKPCAYCGHSTEGGTASFDGVDKWICSDVKMCGIRRRKAKA